MKTKRAKTSVAFFAYDARRGFSPIFVTAALSVIALLAVAGYEIERSFADRSGSLSYTSLQARSPQTPSLGSGSDTVAQLAERLLGTAGTSSPEGSTPLGDAVVGELVNRYNALAQQGLYTPQAGQTVAQNMATELTATISHHTFSASDLTIDTDTSGERMLRYRSDLQTSLAPLLKNKNPEFEVFGRYVDSKDPKYLDELRAMAKNYTDAADLTSRVSVPKDAATVHLNILNSLSEFSATLAALADNATDPFAAIVVLRSYNQAEADVTAAFNALVTYEKAKTP